MQVADIAREIATFARMGGADHHDEAAVWQCFERMIGTDAMDTKDILALLATVRTLLNANMLPEDTQEGYGQHCALLLLRNAIRAVERLSGEREATYTGREWQ